MQRGITAEATLSYWRVAKAFNGHPQCEPLTVQQAFQLLNPHLSWMGQHRRVIRRMYLMQQAIIEGKPRKAS